MAAERGEKECGCVRGIHPEQGGVRLAPNQRYMIMFNFYSDFSVAKFDSRNIPVQTNEHTRLFLARIKLEHPFYPTENPSVTSLILMYEC